MLYSVNHHTYLHTAVLLAAFTYWYSLHSQHLRENRRTQEATVEDAWLHMLQLPPANFKRVVVGFNSNVDLIVSGPAALSALNVSSTEATDLHVINDAEELSRSFAFHFAHGKPGERFIADSKTFDLLLAETERLPHAVAIGGNAALLATRLAQRLWGKMDVHLVGPIGPRARQLLHQNIIIQNSARIAKDELHIIMEYKQGQVYGEQMAPASGRYIASHDVLSGSSVVMDMFFNTVASQRPDLVIISGLHLLQHQVNELFQEKIRMIRRNLGQVSRQIPVHVQLGSLSNPDYSRIILTKVVASVDSVGLVDQELLYLYQLRADHKSEPVPRALHVHKVVDMIDWLLNTYGHERGSNDGKRLSRVHLQSLTYHIIATRGEDWSNAAAALAAGALESARQGCGAGGGSDRIDTDMVDIRISTAAPFMLDRETGTMYKFNAHNPHQSWMRNDIVFVFTPLLVCKYPQRTVGVADAVTAQALAYSQYFRYQGRKSAAQEMPLMMASSEESE